jgi:hypothetical protein
MSEISNPGIAIKRHHTSSRGIIQGRRMERCRKNPDDGDERHKRVDDLGREQGYF